MPSRLEFDRRVLITGFGTVVQAALPMLPQDGR